MPANVSKNKPKLVLTILYQSPPPRISPQNSLCNISAQPGHKGLNVKGVREPIVWAAPG